MKRSQKVIAILPAYHAEHTLKQTVDDIPKEWVDDIIVVDDASKDNTATIARSLGLSTFVHPKNRGYGGNQKTCYRQALARKADIVVMVHPDHQYDPTMIPALLTPLMQGEADAVFGSRMMIKRNALAGGMPYWKFAANIGLTALENAVLGMRLTEYHSCFRAYNKTTLSNVRF